MIWWMTFLFILTSGQMVVESRFLILMWRSRERGLSSTPQLLFLKVINGDVPRILMAGLRVAPPSSQELSLQSLQRAEYWGAILASQAYSGIRIGIDNLNVLRGVAKIIGNGITGTPLPLVKDGDFLAAIHS